MQDELTLKLDVREPSERHRRVYRSEVDGSAQYYAVNPPVGAVPEGAERALFLSLHGAGVEGWGQANAYSLKSWGYLAAATNRRPFGFDWEDWGRLDAIDVLEQVLAGYPIDRTRVYLTGHSMGGHGTWQVGAHFPDRFAAIGPSAGWCSFSTYGSRRRGRGDRADPDAVEAFLRRTAAPSDTLLLRSNYAQQGIFIIHGDADRNVPVREAREMAKMLGEFHRDFRVHEQPGAGHWWDDDPEPGAACVDFQPMFDFFARRRLVRSDEVRVVDFTTVNPMVSDRCHWIRIGRQVRRLLPSRVNVRFDPSRLGMTGGTENVAAFCASPRPLQSGKLSVELDGQKLEVEVGDGDHLHFVRSGDAWKVAAKREPGRTPRTGPFKEAFRHDFVLVVGTQGTGEETRWALQKARYDAETFWYRGNGSVEVVRDEDYRPGQQNRDIILYGNASTNSLWKPLLGTGPVQVDRASVRIGDKKIEGADLACLFVRPNPSDDQHLVGVVSGTGPIGLRLASRMPYFVSGVHYPDVFVAGAEMLDRGVEGVRGAGFFGPAWGVETGEFVWRD